MTQDDKNAALSFGSWSEFYPYYLQEHSNSTCRRLHFVGTSLVIALIVYFGLSGSWSMWWLLPLLGYGFAWVGHFVFEKNKPATFKFPLYSLCSDFVMWKDILMRKIPW